MNNLINLLTKILTIMNTAIIVVGVLFTAYETLSRVIPTSKVWSIIGNVLLILKRVSDALDNRKP